MFFLLKTNNIINWNSLQFIKIYLYFLFINPIEFQTIYRTIEYLNDVKLVLFIFFLSQTTKYKKKKE